MDIAIVNGLFVRMAGPPSAPPLILLHAFADSGLAFVPLFATPLARRFRLVAVDLAGFGVSPAQRDVRDVAGHAGAVAALARSVSASEPVGLIAHSMTSMIAVEAAERLGPRFRGLFSIEGNLTAGDAYFSGRAADYDAPAAFKQSFLDAIWEMAQAQPVFRRYHAGVVAADPDAMWHLGRDARRLSVGDGPGQAYRRARPSLYYWSESSTTAASRRWIAESGLDHRQFRDASHWPMIDQPEATANAIAAFFGG
jgi:pimeloyl-ACP methyl ester carboxylesterase